MRIPKKLINTTVVCLRGSRSRVGIGDILSIHFEVNSSETWYHEFSLLRNQ